MVLEVRKILLLALFLISCMFRMTTNGQEKTQDYTSKVPHFTFGNTLQEQEYQ